MESKRERLENMLEWLITPQDEKEQALFKEQGLVDTYIEIKNKIPYMTEEQLVNEINIQLEPYNLSVGEVL